MTDDKLTAADAHALLGDHIEGSLEGPVRAQVDRLLASDAALAAEHRRLEGTLALLHELPVPTAPVDMVAKVRARLALERPAAEVVRPLWRRLAPLQLGIGLAAAASIAVFVAVSRPEQHRGHSEQTSAAGLAGEVPVVAATLVVPELAPSLIDEAARTAGMLEVSEGIYEGGRRETARFVFALKTAAAERGLEVSGFVPDAARARIEVKSR